jgi:BTB/POZ domain-containing protein KCTD9
VSEKEQTSITIIRSTEREVKLQIGERFFTTTINTLQKSELLARTVSARWNNEREDGAWFFDADGDLFEHILRFLRRGVPPNPFDNS